ncbi:MAG: Mut7-C RNAse domain-containing protein [Candidatus Thermoplasmatota archaeon]|nr:Mut7-C RNAse domain-containing protein [Candidatus Thermoplasmatota archaeon]
MKFLCDQMLGTLAKWLRIYGFDTFYANSTISDDKIIMISKKEDRCLITRDEELAFRCKKENIKIIHFKVVDLDEQINLVLHDLVIDKDKILSRCIICNSELSDIKKDAIKDKVPIKVFQKHEEFWFCKKCDKIYWKGSHYDKMIQKLIDL